MKNIFMENKKIDLKNAERVVINNKKYIKIKRKIWK